MGKDWQDCQTQKKNERTGFLICNVNYFLEQNNRIIKIKI